MKENRTCVICKDEFRTKSTSNRKTCGGKCAKKNLQNYYHSSEYRELQKKSQQIPENKEKARLRCQSPEYKERKRLYRQTPEYKARRKLYQRRRYQKMKLPESIKNKQKCQNEYLVRLDIKEKISESGKEYSQSPDVKERYQVKKRIVNCVICGIEFEAKVKTQKNCSNECSKKHHKQCVRKRQLDPRVIAEAKVKRDMSENRKEKKPLKIKNCIVCDVEFETNHGTKINCSTECYKKYNKQCVRKRQLDPKVIAKEKARMQSLPPQNNRKPQKTKRCIVCGIAFVTSHGTKINCSPKCSEKHNLEYIQSPEYKVSRKEYYQNLSIKVKIKNNHERKEEMKIKC